jgi:GNAT superfamily N-acetyltransferase
MHATVEKLIQVRTPDELSRLEEPAGLPPFMPEDLVHHAPDAHWLLLNSDGQAVGRHSLWWQRTPPHQGHRLGIIGHYAAADATKARLLLQHACAQLAAKGVTLAVGPMDGNTWRRYRFITERGSEPLFFLEPDHPDEWPLHFAENGFVPLAQYFSGLNSDLSQEDTRIQDAAERFTAAGLRVRPLQMQRFDEELRKIYAVSEISFKNNFLYTPVSQEDFLGQYHRLEKYVRPELVLIAEQQQRPVGFIFTIPDLLQGQRGQVIDTVIIKTVAVLPDRAHAGLGGYLVGHSQIVARELGYKRVIHALMHESNASRNISGHYARTMRRYTLFARTLTS